MVSQLSLFDSSTVIKPLYHVGDRVMVRKKPIGASYIKKGDIVEIVAVHPRDRSIKFWNERSERWEYLHPDEIGRIVTRKDDSPTMAEVAVGESIAQDDSPTMAEVAVGESIAQDDDYLALNPISAYQPRGTARGGKYFRLSYREGDKVRQVHIRGGNTDSPIAQAKVQEVRSLLAAGISPAEIATMLRKK